MTYVFLKSLERDKKFKLYALGSICHLCGDKREESQNCSCSSVFKCGGFSKEWQLDLQNLWKCGCEKAVAYTLLKTGMIVERLSWRISST